MSTPFEVAIFDTGIACQFPAGTLNDHQLRVKCAKILNEVAKTLISQPPPEIQEQGKLIVLDQNTLTVNVDDDTGMATLTADFRYIPICFVSV